MDSEVKLDSAQSSLHFLPLPTGREQILSSLLPSPDLPAGLLKALSNLAFLSLPQFLHL